MYLERFTLWNLPPYASANELLLSNTAVADFSLLRFCKSSAKYSVTNSWECRIWFSSWEHGSKCVPQQGPTEVCCVIPAVGAASHALQVLLPGCSCWSILDDLSFLLKTVETMLQSILANIPRVSRHAAKYSLYKYAATYSPCCCFLSFFFDF